MFILIGLVVGVLLLGALAPLLPRDERPNARIVAICGEDLRAEVVCQDCGARRLVRFTAGLALASVCCPECDRNILPIFGRECQQLILQAAQEAADEAAAAVREAWE